MSETQTGDGQTGPDLSPDSVRGRVDAVVDDLLKDRVLSRQVADLEKAASRAKQDAAIGRIGRL